MTGAESRRREEALDWVRMIHDPAFADWDAHIAWLEADPLNASIFDAVSLEIEKAVADLAPSTSIGAADAANDNVQAEGRARRWRMLWIGGIGGAVAAGLATLAMLPTFDGGGASPYRIDAPPGASSRLALLDGTSIALNGGSAIELDHANARVARLIRGEAFFQVVHDAAHPFQVQAAGRVFQDVGTAFDVVSEAGGVRLAVREGAVLYDPRGAALRLDGGQQIAFDAAGARVERVDPEAVGGWRQGKLSYRDATYAVIATDLARSIGQPVRLDPRLAARHFSGVIVVDPDRNRMFRRIAMVMDVAVRLDGDVWQIAPHGP